VSRRRERQTGCDATHTLGKRPYRLWRSALMPLTVLLAALMLGAGLLPGTTPIALAAPLTTNVPQHPTTALHALPVREDPPADAILQAPPSQVRMWFSEDLNPLTSKIVVVSTTNHEVDLGDSHVVADNPREMIVSLPLLSAGTYVVVWRTQSAEDGHIVSGSYIFRIARPDGSVPPIPKVLPTSHIIGGGQALATGTLDGPTTVQAIMTWLALLFMVFWVGGVIWETWILAPRLQTDPDLRAAAQAAVARFRTLAPYVLAALLVADVGIILAEAAELAGDWSGAFSPILLRAIIFGSRYGLFWWMRQLVALAALAATLLIRPPVETTGAEADEEQASEMPSHPIFSAGDETATQAIPDWRRELVKTLRDIPQLPRQLWRGLRARSGEGVLSLLLGAALIAAFALSGHAAAVSASELGYALSVDIFHLIATTAWLGGLLYIAVVLLPALRGLTSYQRARVVALGLPQFGALALVCAVLLAATGSLNTAIHLTSIEQFFTTTYGRTLAVKIELFLIMAAISAYHAFFLRPRLAHVLTEETSSPGKPDAGSQRKRYNEPQGETPRQRRSPASGERAKRNVAPTSGKNALAIAGATGSGSYGLRMGRMGRMGTTSSINAAHQANGHARQNDSQAEPTSSNDDASQGSSSAQRLTHAIEDWLRREATLGVGVLLCVALLGAFAGSLYSLPLAPSAHSSGAFTQMKTAGGYHISLTVTPDAFGTNTFNVTLTNTQGQPVNGAAVLIQTNDLDMDMGVQSAQLKAVGASSPGVYSGQSDLTMAGHWQITVKVLPPGSQQFVITSFKLTATYS